MHRNQLSHCFLCVAKKHHMPTCIVVLQGAADPNALGGLTSDAQDRWLLPCKLVAASQHSLMASWSILAASCRPSPKAEARSACKTIGGATLVRAREPIADTRESFGSGIL